MIPAEHLKVTCRPGSGADTCRYLAFGEGGFICAKLKPGLKATIDKRGDAMNAKGDNCDGIEA